MTILRDWAQEDPDAFHRFLWSNHLAYAKWHEKSNEFGSENLLPTRRMLFDDLNKFLIDQCVDRSKDITSVFDVGCSSGFLLRYMETDVFPSATIFEGNDIDGPAIQRGEAYLREHKSKVHLINADMAKLNSIMDGSTFDLIFCAGVLVYLHEEAATEVIRAMLNHCSGRGFVVIFSTGHPDIDNSKLEHSIPRKIDELFYHNIDAMVKKADGEVLYRRWDGARKEDKGQHVYFVFCRPKASSLFSNN